MTSKSVPLLIFKESFTGLSMCTGSDLHFKFSSFYFPFKLLFHLEISKTDKLNLFIYSIEISINDGILLLEGEL